jgi:uncharacterized protein YhaN
MHFLELHLKAFGHFTDYRIDLNHGRSNTCGLHLIVGDNEAGKSTVLAAIERLLFGFSKSGGNFDFVHRANKLLVGARIGDRDGTERMYLRRKTGDALTTADGRTELPRNLFEEHLDSLTPSQYVRLFGLDQKRLREGGEELVNCEGDFARILFAESLGELDRFEIVRKQLEQTSAKLFRPGARGKANTPLNQLKVERDSFQKELLDTTTTAQKWTQLNQDLAREIKRRNDLDAEIERLQTESSRFDRLNRSLEAVRELDAINDRIKELGDLPDISDELRSEFVGILEQAKSAKSKLEEADSSIDAANRTIDSIRLDNDLLNSGERIERLARQAAAIESIRSRFETRQVEISDGSIELEDKLASLGFVMTSLARVPRHDDLRVHRLRSARDRLNALTESIARTSSDIVLLESQRKEAESELADIEAPGDLTKIDAAISRSNGMQERMSRLDSLRNDLLKYERQINTKVASLPLWTGSPTEFESLKLPDFELVRQDAERFESASRIAEDARKETDQVARELTRKKALLANRLAEFKIPSPEELAAARTNRDRIWDNIKSRWLTHDSSESGQSYQGTDTDLATDFEARTKHADRLSDLLRDHLETLKLQVECGDEEANLRYAESRHASLADEASRAFEAWASHFEFLTAKPKRIDEFKSWPEKSQAIRELIENKNETQDTIASIEQDWSFFFHKMIAPLSTDRFSPGFSFDDCMNELRKWRDEIVESKSERQSRTKRIQAIRIAIDKANEKLTAEQNQRIVAESEWTNSLAECEFPLRVLPESLESILTSITSALQEYKRLESDRSKLQVDIQEAENFEKEVDALSNQLRFSPDSSDPVRVLESIRRSSNIEREKSKTLEQTRSSLAKELETREISSNQLRIANSRISEICSEIGVDDPSEAIQRFEAIAHRNSLKREAEKSIARLDGLRHEEPLDQWILESRNLAPEIARERIEQLQSILAEFKDKRESVSEIIYSFEIESKRIRDSVSSAEILAVEQRRKAFFEETRDRVRLFLKCQLTMNVLRDAAESYRKRMGEQVIDMASGYLRALSLGSLAGVMTTEIDSKRKLLAIRSVENEPLELHQLSEGTRDQLFLALKLAMIRNRLIERQKKNKAPLPVIFDDILVNFDDARAAAAFRLLAELAETTQVIYLTHHRHLETVANATLGAGSFGVHRLSSNGLEGPTGNPDRTPRTSSQPLRFLEDIR